MKPLKWEQVHAWRVKQHCLTNRLPRRDFIRAAEAVSGIQAQLMSAAELALWARTEKLTPEDVQTALWRDHTLIKTWAMRGTLHLIASDELPLFVAARNYHDSRNWIGYFAYYGFDAGQYEQILAAIPEVLGSEPMTREALATALAERTHMPQLRDLILGSSWGSPLKPAAFRGDVCFGPSQGQNVTFVNPRKWISDWKPIAPEDAIREIIRRYLRAYGPATLKDFALWWWGGGGLTQGKKALQSLGDELEAVEVEGWEAVALRDSLDAMQHIEPEDNVHLLPLFDAYTLGVGRDIEPLLPKKYKLRVYRPQGWISAVVLVNGCMKGAWEYKTGRSGTVVTVRLFDTPTAKVKRGIEAEAERLGTFLNSPVAVVYEIDS